MLLLPVILGLLILAAHFLRNGNIVFLFISLAALPILLIREKWVVLFFRILLTLATMEWLKTTWLLVSTRIEFEQPYLRMAIILGCVSLLTFLSIFVFNAEKLKKRYMYGSKGLKT